MSNDSDEGPYRADDAGKLAGELFSGKFGIEEALARLRTRLLDLSLRNRLLNYKHPKGRSFQFTNDPDLNLLFERLEAGSAIPLAHVLDPPPRRYEGGKKPDVRLYAKEAGIGVSVDIQPPGEPTSHRRLPPLQLLHYPTDLERLARKVSTEARTVVEETGTNMLYLMFGFLEYFDSEDSATPILAPLLSMPVNLMRGALDLETRTYKYELSHSGEDIAENFTLREKLRQVHFELPTLAEDDTPEAYFEKISQASINRPNWSVKRRLTLGFLSFGKLAIWIDLDPAKSQSLLTSPLLRDIFEGGRAQASDAFHAEDYDIDSHPDAELPLIYDADSSQHSAIIDVKAGKSLVINGPPGTGKSQTITNIVASAIAGGKKVLFVSEKLAALEVVKQRLQAAGLGDFCLELHSHKTQKKQLLASIQQRMGGRYSTIVGYEKKLEVLRERRSALNTYAELLGSRVGNKLDLTVHEVFWATERRRASLGPAVDAVSGFVIQGADGRSASVVDKCRKVLIDIAGSLKELGCSPPDSPWYGYYPGLLIRGDEVQLLRTIDDALAHARAMETEAEVLRFVTGIDWSIGQLEFGAEAVPTLLGVPPNLDGQLLAQMFATGLRDLSRVSAEVSRLTGMLSQVRGLKSRASQALVRLDVVDELAFQNTELAGIRCLNDYATHLPASELKSLVHDLVGECQKVTSRGGERSSKLPRDVAGMRQAIADFAKHCDAPLLLDEPVNRLIEASELAATSALEVKGAIDQIDAVLKDSGVPFLGHVDELRAHLDGRGMPELLVAALPQDGATLEELRKLSSGGWRDWTAERFSATARDIGEQLSTANQSTEELRGLFNRIGIPVETTKSGLDSIEALLAVAESAPLNLLSSRQPGLERADFAELVTRAEDTKKSVEYRGSKVDAALHVDMLPDESALREHIKVLRRGDSFVNFLKSDWRRAKSAYQVCAKDAGKKTAADMAGQFAEVHAWRTALAEFVGQDQFRTVLGAMFEGIRTDFDKVRRLHNWTHSNGLALLDTDFAATINLISIPEQHIALLRGSASRVRAWVGNIKQLRGAVGSLPGLDPALARARKADEIFKPLELYVKSLNSAAALLRDVVRPTASVGRAVELLSLRQRILEHADVFRALLSAPQSLCAAGVPLGLAGSPLSCQDIRTSVVTLAQRAQRIRELAQNVASGMGESETLQSAFDVLHLLGVLSEAAAKFLADRDIPVVGLVTGVANARLVQAHAVLAMTDGIEPYARPSISVGQAVSGIRAALDAELFLANISADSGLLSMFGPYLQGLSTDEVAISTCLSWASSVSQVVTKLPVGAADCFVRSGAAEAAPAAGAALSTGNDSRKAYERLMDALSQTGRLDWNLWGGFPLPSDAVIRLERARDGSVALIPWSKYLAAKDDASELGVSELVLAAESGRLFHGHLVDAFEYVFYRSLSRGILGTHRDLARFSGGGHETLRREFSELDREVIRLNGGVYAAKVDAAKKPQQGIGTGRAGDLSEMALLVKETTKKTKHIPIRQLLKRAGKSLQELKPCFMMGPLSVAQYLEQGVLQFDLVVMDEASQLRPEEALGAIARGKQLVVVGDPKQLPPTNFFDRLMEPDDEDPDDTPAVVDGVESVLGICELLYRPVRTLRWHYRSRHESLIAFSNKQFYDGRLVVFPSPFKRNKRLGVNYRYVPDGIYQDRRNQPEAQRLVDAVVEHMLKCPEESLGVVTLNQTQRELIEDLLDKKVRGLKGVAEYLDRHEQAGWKFFIKNLENVQGDERDVIFVSTTFGKPPGASVVRQNFGPINRPDGWRRLNVLFTRARMRLDLFSSMLPSDVKLDEKASLGRRALQQYLEYAKTGILPSALPVSTGRQADSDFEVSVAGALRIHGFDAEPQVGVAGYFIDIGVKHPDRRGEYLAGIECDGATYHSSLSARDRDRIRQEIIESLGWRGRIIRVWSTDWFADPQGQTLRLTQFLQQRRTDDKGLDAPYADDQDFDDDADEEIVDVPSAEVEVVPTSTSAVSEQLSLASIAVVRVRATSDDRLSLAEQSQDVVLFIDLGDRVTYEVIDVLNERHTVQIVDSASNARLGLINEGTPVARVLYGLCVGDEAPLKVAGQQSRRLRVLKIARESQGSMQEAN